MDTKTRVTLADVAVAAGVSKMTASRALRGTGDVSQTNVEKVRQAARDIGYVGNHLASSLSGQRSDLIGVVVPSLTNIVFAEVLAGIADGLSGSGKQPVFGVTEYNLETEYEVVRNMLSWNPTGLIVTGLDQSDDTRKLLENADVPVVQIMDVDGTPVDACVGLSHFAAGEAMAQALVNSGRTRFAYVGCGLELDTRAAKRFAGFKAGLASAGLGLIATETAAGLSTVGAGRIMTETVLKQHPDLDCIYYSNDDVAAGGAFHCIAAGIAIPEQLVLAGFNGLEFVNSLPVRIATSQTPRRDIGKVAAEIVLSSDRGRGQQIVYHPTIDLGDQR